LLQHYCNTFSGNPRREAPEISEECLQLLLHYGWPGNIRELKNTVEWMLQGEPPGQINPEHLPQNLRKAIATAPLLSASERDLLLSALFSTKWNKSEAARSLHWSRMTLYRKLAKYHIRQGHDDASLPR
jgi:DNA-binding NtrC family response regulator